MKDNKATAELLRCAADHIEQVGLHKGNYFKGLPEVPESDEDVLALAHGDFKNAPCCVFGALFVCADAVDEVSDAARRAELTIRHDYSLDEWNDLPSRRKGHVVRMFRRAADELDSES